MQTQEGWARRLTSNVRRRAVARANAKRAELNPTLLDHLRKYRPGNQVFLSFQISFRNRMIYLPIGKVANSSIKAFLFQAEARSLGIPLSRRTMPTPRNVHNPCYGPLLRGYQLPRRTFEHALASDKFFKFVFVRNPYDRLLSCFLDRVAKPGSGPNRHALELVKKQSGQQITFEEFVQGIKSQQIRDMDPHWRTQYYEAGLDHLTYSFIGRFERLEQDLRHVISKVYGDEMVSALKLTENYSPAATEAQSRLQEFYTDAAIAAVNEVYERDFKQFGYKMVEHAKDMAAV